MDDDVLHSPDHLQWRSAPGNLTSNQRFLKGRCWTGRRRGDQMNAETSTKTTADLVREVTELVPRLVQEEFALAKAELSEKGKHAGVGAGLFGGGGLFAFFGLALLLT